MNPLLLFDVDGTLLVTGGAGMRAMRRVAAELFGDQFTWDGIEVSGHLDPLIFSEAASLNGLDPSLHHEEFRHRYLGALREELERGRGGVRAMPGVHETLARFRARVDVTLGLLTGNYTDAIPIKLGSIGVDPSWFSVSAFGDEADSRPALVALVLEKYSRRLGFAADPRRVIVVGDTPRDVACAHAHGCIAFAVATGPYEVSELRAAGANVVVSDLGDPSPLLELVDQLCDTPGAP